MWKSFGADVTIVEALPRLVPAEDEAISKLLERAFRKRGIGSKTGTPFETVEPTDDGVRVTVEGGETIEAEVLLVAVGRGPVDRWPRVRGAGRRRWTVASCSPTSVCAPASTASTRSATSSPASSSPTAASPQGIFVAEEIAGLAPTPIDDDGIPRVTYCDPEVASVGLTEAPAQDSYGADAVESLTYDLGGNGKSQILKTAGIREARTPEGRPVVGVHMVGARVGELIGEAQLIYNWEAYPEDVAPLVHAHPTQNEALGEAHLALAGKPLHAHS